MGEVEDQRGPTRLYSPEGLLSVLQAEVEGSLGHYEMAGLSLEGTIGPFSDNGRYRAIYGVPLVGPEGSSIELIIPRGELGEAALALTGHCVRIRGDLKANLFRGKLSFRVVVRSIEAVSKQEGDSETTKNLLSLLSGYRRYRRPFPEGRDGSLPSVTVIEPASGKVGEDFRHALGSDLARRLSLTTHPTNFLSPAEVAAEIGRAGGEVVALIRGGGPAEEISALDDPEILEAWMESGAYTICGVGHATDSTLLGAVSDAAAETPTAAGGLLKRELAAIAERRVESQRAASADEARRQAQQSDQSRREAEESLGRQRFYTYFFAALALAAILISLAASAS